MKIQPDSNECGKSRGPPISRNCAEDRDAFGRPVFGRCFRPALGATVYHSNGSEAIVQSLLRVASVALAEDFKAMNASGIASRYPGDKNIANDLAVIFADDFESYTSPTQLTNNWDAAYHLPNIRIATEPNNVFSGNKSLEFSLPISTDEVSNSAKKIINPTQDTVFIRAYTKFDPGYQVTGSNHDGLRLSAQYPGPSRRPPPDGTGFFLFLLQNNVLGSPRIGESAPGFTHLYSGHGSGQRLATIGILPDSWFLLTAE